MVFSQNILHDATSVIGVISTSIGVISGAIATFGKIRGYFIHRDTEKIWRITIRITFIIAVLSFVVFVGDYTYANFFQKTPCCPPIATATPTPIPMPMLVQHHFQNVDTALNTIKFANSVSSGNLIIVAVTQFENTFLNISDNNNDTYVAAATSQSANSPNDYVELYYAKNAKGGPTIVTANFSTSGDGNDGSNVGIYEYSGLNTASPLEQGLSNIGNGNILNGVPLTTKEDNEICFAVGVDSGLDNTNDPNINKPPTPGIGFMIEDQQDNSVMNERFYTEDATNIKAGSPGCKPNFSIPYSTNWAIIGAAFKP